MDWKRIEKSADVKLSGASVDITRENGSIKEIVLSDDVGNRVRIGADYSGLIVTVPAPAQTRKVSVIEGVIAEAPVSVSVEGGMYDYEVKSRKSDLESHGVQNVTVREVTEDIPF